MAIRFNKPTRVWIGMSKDVKQVLYSVIDDIGREKIRADVNSNIHSSTRYCTEIVYRCRQELGSEANYETLGTLCEALLHFMLTASLLPSERKVVVAGTELDIVIPSVKSLTKSPQKALVIQVLKNKEDLTKIREAQNIQKNVENLWLISIEKTNYSGRNYSLDDSTYQYSSIIVDIHTFLARNGIDNRLRMLSG
jgi:hypothetical protein